MTKRKFRWIEIPPETDLPMEGQVRSLRVQGRMVCMARKGGKLLAMKNQCPHAGGPMGMGWLNEKGDIVCPLHRFTFDPQSGRSTDGQSFYVEVYEVRADLDGMFVGIPKRGWFG